MEPGEKEKNSENEREIEEKLQCLLKSSGWEHVG